MASKTTEHTLHQVPLPHLSTAWGPYIWITYAGTGHTEPLKYNVTHKAQYSKTIKKISHCQSSGMSTKMITAEEKKITIYNHSYKVVRVQFLQN